VLEAAARCQLVHQAARCGAGWRETEQADDVRVLEAREDCELSLGARHIVQPFDGKLEPVGLPTVDDAEAAGAELTPL